MNIGKKLGLIVSGVGAVAGLITAVKKIKQKTDKYAISDYTFTVGGVEPEDLEELLTGLDCRIEKINNGSCISFKSADDFNEALHVLSCQK